MVSPEPTLFIVPNLVNLTKHIFITTIPFYYSINYRNIHCAACARIPLHIPDFPFCGAQIFMAYEPPPYYPGTTLSILFDFGISGQLMYHGFSTELQCIEGTVQVGKECLGCSDGTAPVNGTCHEVLSLVESITLIVDAKNGQNMNIREDF